MKNVQDWECEIESYLFGSAYCLALFICLFIYLGMALTVEKGGDVIQMQA